MNLRKMERESLQNGHRWCVYPGEQDLEGKDRRKQRNQSHEDDQSFCHALLQPERPRRTG